MKCRKGLVSEEELLDSKSGNRSFWNTWADFAESNTYDKHKELSSSLCRGFCTSVLFIIASMNTWVCQDLLCCSYVKEHLLSLFFVLSLISIWMPLPGQFAISLIDFSLGCRSVHTITVVTLVSWLHKWSDMDLPTDTKYLVVISFLWLLE